MTTMRLIQRLPVGEKELKIDVDPTKVAYLTENVVVLSNGASIDVKESLQSLRHRHRKALAEQAALLREDPNTPEEA